VLVVSDLDGFVAIAHRVVWATLTTVDAHNRPRSRVVHPVWESTPDGLIGRVCTRATPLKRAHIAHSPYASVSYWDPAHDVAVAECAAAWDPHPERTWPVFRAHPEPVGFDPETVFEGGTAHPQAAVLELRPWRLRWARAADLAAGRGHVVVRIAPPPAHRPPSGSGSMAIETGR
jgi:hypothetical protein